MQVTEGVELAHYNLGLAFRQKGYYAEAQREYQLALERGEDRALVLQAMAEVHLLRKDPEAAITLYDNLIPRDSRTVPSFGTSAASPCIRTGALRGRRRIIGTRSKSIRSTRSRTTISVSRCTTRANAKSRRRVPRCARRERRGS